MNQIEKAMIFKVANILSFFFFLNCFGGLAKEYPSKKYYLITVDNSKFGNLKKKFPYVKVNKFKISSIYDSKNFIYKYSEVGYEADFYNEFLVFPVTNISEVFTRWVDQVDLGLLSPSVFENEKLYILSGNIISLYGDFRDSKTPLAIIEIDVYIQRALDMGIVYRRKFEQKIKIPKPEPEELVKGWNLGLQNILIDLEQELAKLNVK